MISRFSRPVSSSWMAADCPASPIERRTAAACRTTSWPSTSARPLSGSSRVVRMRTAVVLPAPFGPRTPRTVPRGTERSIPRSACTSPNDWVRPSTKIAGPELFCVTSSSRADRRPCPRAQNLPATRAATRTEKSSVSTQCRRPGQSIVRPATDRKLTAISSPAELLASKYGMSPEQAADAQREMEQRAAQDGLEFRLGGLRRGNTRDAPRLLQLAKDRGVQAELAERLHRAYFTEQASIFDHASLTELAVETGLDRGEVSKVLDSDEYSDAVDT